MDDAALLIAELLARRWLPRSHPRVKRALVDAELFAQVEQRLAQSGLRFMDSIYAEHVSIALLPAAQNSVLGEAGLNTNNNIDLPRDAQALLVVLWALIVLPKRERQTSRMEEPEVGQNDMFPGAKPLPVARLVSPVISYKALLEDYGPQLGKKLRLDANLKLLERHGFITRKQDEIGEGPLLDVLLDYDVLAPRILDGALADVLAREKAQRESEDAAAANVAAPVPMPLPVPAPTPAGVDVETVQAAAPAAMPVASHRPAALPADPATDQSYVQSVTEPPVGPDVEDTIEAAIDDFDDERAATPLSPGER